MVKYKHFGMRSLQTTCENFSKYSSGLYDELVTFSHQKVEGPRHDDFKWSKITSVKCAFPAKA